MLNIFLYCVIIVLVECKYQFRGIGGRDAARDEYPYVVSIQVHIISSNELNKTSSTVSVQSVCTGSVLTPAWTVSAAHCFAGNINLGNISLPGTSWISLQHENVAFVISNKLLNSTLPYHKRHSHIDYVVLHHAFRLIQLNHFGGDWAHNDVGLVRHEPFYVNQFAKVAGLDYASLIGHEVVLAGYGLTYDSEGKLFPATELFKTFQVLDAVVIKCAEYVPVYPVLCVASKCKKEITRACPGDSGGPLIHPGGVAGVISTSYVCRQRHISDTLRIAALVTPLSPYIQWIADHTSQMKKF